jgi:hypothetical protein
LRAPVYPPALPDLIDVMELEEMAEFMSEDARDRCGSRHVSDNTDAELMACQSCPTQRMDSVDKKYTNPKPCWATGGESVVTGLVDGIALNAGRHLLRDLPVRSRPERYTRARAPHLARAIEQVAGVPLCETLRQLATIGSSKRYNGQVGGNLDRHQRLPSWRAVRPDDFRPGCREV